MLSGLEKKTFPTSLQGARIRLVRPTAPYTAGVWAYIQRDHALGGKNYVWITSIDEVEKYITCKSADDPREVTYLILKDDVPIGSFHIHTIHYSDYKAEVGYAIEKGEEGHGYVSEALQLVAAEMKNLGFNKLVINCDANNLRSINIALRNGFLREGTLVHDYVVNGQFRDSALFGRILKSDGAF